MNTTIDQFKGCLIGGAVGNALGAPIEFMSINQIRSEYGEQGLKDYTPAYGKIGAITDDTQMLLFTAEGLILSKVRPEYSNCDKAVQAVYHALLRWLYTQDTHRQNELIKNFGTCSIVDGILTGHKELFSQRAPGNTSLSALRSGKMGTINNPLNDSKGCGGVMRVAPVGLAYTDAEEAFRIACECAAITHGHPSAYLASGYLAALISVIVSGTQLRAAIVEATKILKKYQGHNECLIAVEKAVEYSEHLVPTPENIEKLGGGWIAEEALSISLYCALISGDDFKRAALLAVNHSGDSDSIGSITGNIFGSIYGTKRISHEWIVKLELRDVIEEIAGDLFNQFQN
jgi:ADP-ribosylglycohydrolase